MKRTTKLSLYAPEITDDVQDTIDKFANNMVTLDDNYDEIVPNIESALNKGTTYPIGKKVWNRQSTIGGNAGWVNTRGGIFAPLWKPLFGYAVGDIIRPSLDNGHYFECITSGSSASLEPIFDTATYGVTNDLRGATPWQANNHYYVGDIIVENTSGLRTFFYRCISEGISASTEPVWNRSEGQSTTTGTVKFVCYRTAVWREKGTSCDFVPFGYIGEAARKYTETIGDGALKTIDVAHNLNTQDVVVMVRSTHAPFDVASVTMQIKDKNTVSITFATKPNVDEYKVTVIG